MKRHGRISAILAVLLFGWIDGASAKVVFTGYADFRLTPQSVSKVSGPAAALASVGATESRNESRTFAMDSVGLFAATSLFDDAEFVFDITYRRVGATIGETRLQYAYLRYHPEPWEFQAGRITLPLGYYNQNRFYPFQRASVTSPLYQSAIIGLPIADHGILAAREIDAGPVLLRGSVYVVNGYGASRSSTDTFRAGLGASDSLLIANNLSSTNNNKEFAYGGNLRASFLEKRNLKVGVSSYRGAWSVEGDDFTMLNAYTAFESGPFNLIAEGLRTETENDGGLTGFFASRDWTSSGWFVEGSVAVMRRDVSEVLVFAGTERTVAKGRDPGASGVEQLLQHKIGVSWQLNPNVFLKTEANMLDFELPLQVAGRAQTVQLDQRQLLFSLVLTY